MRQITSIAAALALAVSAMTFSAPAKADDDAFIAGAAGFALGTLFGHATARPHYRQGYYYPRAHYAPRPGLPRVSALDARLVQSLRRKIPVVQLAHRLLRDL